MLAQTLLNEMNVRMFVLHKRTWSQLHVSDLELEKYWYSKLNLNQKIFILVLLVKKNRLTGRPPIGILLIAVLTVNNEYVNM